MKSFIEEAQIYAQFHQNPKTLYTHLVGVPLIMFSFMVLLGFIKIVMPGVFSINFACLVYLALLVYYFRINWQLALTFTPVLLILLWISTFFNHNGPSKIGVWAFIVTFIIGWSLQLYGHFIEGRKPAFIQNWYQGLIAPLFMVAELCFLAGYMQPLKEQIHGSSTLSTDKVIL